MRAVVSQVIQDHSLPLPADYVEGGLNGAVVVRHQSRRFDRAYSHVSTPRFPSYLAVVRVHFIIPETVRYAPGVCGEWVDRAIKQTSKSENGGPLAEASPLTNGYH